MDLFVTLVDILVVHVFYYLFCTKFFNKNRITIIFVILVIFSSLGWRVGLKLVKWTSLRKDGPKPKSG